jgi:hypothetical protein
MNNKYSYLTISIIASILIQGLYPKLKEEPWFTEDNHIEEINPAYPYCFSVINEIAAITGNTQSTNYTHFVSSDDNDIKPLHILGIESNLKQIIKIAPHCIIIGERRIDG